MRKACLLLAVGSLAAITVSSIHGQAIPRTIEVQISPHVIVLDAPVTWVTVHADIGYGSVLPGSVALNGVSARYIKPDSRGDLVAKFAFQSIADIVAPPEATLVLTGSTKDGEPFCGEETIKVRER